jgi:hypothetical protein
VVWEIAVAQFERLEEDAPELAAELEKTVWWLGEPQDDSSFPGSGLGTPRLPGSAGPLPDGDGAPTDLETQLAPPWQDHTLAEVQNNLDSIHETDYAANTRPETSQATPPRDTEYGSADTSRQNQLGAASAPTGGPAGNANTPTPGLAAALSQAAKGQPTVGVNSLLPGQFAGPAAGVVPTLTGLAADLAATLPASLGSMARPDLQLQAAYGQLPGINIFGG